MSRRYLVISPCRDEEDYARYTVDSVVAQTELPAKWVIVDDGSTDGTPAIEKQAAADHDWVEVLTRAPRKTRVLGSGVVHAFNAGLETVNLDDYDYVSKLDVDLILPPTYYEELMDQMEADPRLGTASGRPHIAADGDIAGDRWEAERGAAEMSAGMAKLYRVSTFREIGGLVPEIMWDGIDCHEARSRGWRSRSFDSPRSDFKHLRPEGGSERGVLRGRRRHGYGQWFMGTDPIFMLASAALRVRDDPAVTGSAHMLAGYAGAALRRVPQHGSKQVRAELRRFQRESLVLGKARATRRWEDRTAHRWYETRLSQGSQGSEAVAYLVSAYPTMSHTFVRNEIDGLVAVGRPVVPFSARRGDVADDQGVVVLQETRRRQILRDLAALRLGPRAALSVLAEALAPGGGRPRRAVGLAYLAQAAVLVSEMDRRSLRHVHVHFANNAAEIARLAVLIDRRRGSSSRGLTWSLTVHGLWMHGLGVQGGPAFPDREAGRWGPLADKLTSAAAVLCVDEAARARLAALADSVAPGAGNRVRVVHMGVDVDRFSPAQVAATAPDGSHELTVLFVGRLAPEKSLETLVAGFAAMTYDGPRRLVIVGEGPREEAIRQAIADHGLQRLPGRDATAELRARTSQDDLPDVYRGADIFAMTSLSEGIPVVLMEAMACGLPVVSTEVGGIPEIVDEGHSGLLVPSQDVSALGHALDSLARDPARRVALGRAGRQIVLRSFDARANATRLSDEFERLIGERPAAAPGRRRPGL